MITTSTTSKNWKETKKSISPKESLPSPPPPPPPPKLKSICHISFFQYFSFFNPCFNFMNCDAKKRKLIKIMLKKEKKKFRIFTKSQNKIALSNQFIT
jgi:hypothetical protein